MSTRFGGDPDTPDELPALEVLVGGGADIDGTGRTEIFVQIGSGASTESAAIFRVWQGRLLRVTMDGRPTDLLRAGSVGDLHWFSCDHALFTVVDLEANPDWKSYTLSETRYRLVGPAFVRVADVERTVPPPTGEETNAKGDGCGVPWPPIG